MKAMNIGILRDPYKDKTYAKVDDLIELLKDIREHPENYNQDAVVKLIEQLTGKIPIEPEIPF